MLIPSKITAQSIFELVVNNHYYLVLLINFYQVAPHSYEFLEDLVSYPFSACAGRQEIGHSP